MTLFPPRSTMPSAYHVFWDYIETFIQYTEELNNVSYKSNENLSSTDNLS